MKYAQLPKSAHFLMPYNGHTYKKVTEEEYIRTDHPFNKFSVLYTQIGLMNLTFLGVDGCGAVYQRNPRGDVMCLTVMGDVKEASHFAAGYTYGMLDSGAWVEDFSVNNPEPGHVHLKSYHKSGGEVRMSVWAGPWLGNKTVMPPEDMPGG